MVPFIHAYTVDVRSGMRCERAKYPVGQGDALADRFVVSVMDGGTPVDLKGVGVVATVVRPDGLTVPLKGTIENGTACVTLEDKCYDVGGNITVTVSLEAGEMRQSVLQVALNVATGETDMIAETAVLNVADVLAAAERAEAAADRAESAGGGSGGGLPTGGAANQMLVTDADGNALWEDRTHYTEAVRLEVLPETEAMNADGQFYIPGIPTNQPVIGVNHNVVYNGVSYDCVGMLYQEEEGGVSGVALGNAAALGGENTGQPFFMVILPDELAAEQGICGICMPMDGVESVTISIEINGEVVHPLDEKYIPQSVLSKNTNLVNGRAYGSVRSVNARKETEEYSLGHDSFAYGQYAAAMGNGSIALGNNAYVGPGTNNNFDENSSGTAIGNGSSAGAGGAAVGLNAKAGHGGSAFGNTAEATGYGSFAGPNAEAKGGWSVALGSRTIASSDEQCALGYNNKEDSDGKYVFIVGNGIKETTTSEETWQPRSNAHTLDWDGNAWYAGDVYIGGTSQDDARKLATVEDVLAALPTWNGGAY